MVVVMVVVVVMEVGAGRLDLGKREMGSHCTARQRCPIQLASSGSPTGLAVYQNLRGSFSCWPARPPGG